MKTYSFSLLFICVFATTFLQSPPKRIRPQYDVTSLAEIFSLPAGSKARYKSLIFKVYRKKDRAITDETERTLTPITCKAFLFKPATPEWGLDPGVALQDLFALPIGAISKTCDIIKAFYIDAAGLCYQAISKYSPYNLEFYPLMVESCPTTQTYSLMHQPGSPETVAFWTAYSSRRK